MKELFVSILILLTTLSVNVPREFESTEQAELWIESHHIVPQANGITYLEGWPSDWDCVDWATAFEDTALKAGWKVTVVPVVSGMIWGLPVTNLTSGNHVGVWTRIKGVYYYIETSPSSYQYKLKRITTGY